MAIDGFPFIDKKTWLQKIEKELRGRKLPDDLRVDLGEGIQTDPFLQEDDRIENEQLSSFPDRWSIGILVNAPLENSLLLDYLNLGVSTLILEDISSGVKKTMLQGVDTGIITLVEEINIAESGFHLDRSVARKCLVKDLKSWLNMFNGHRNIHLVMSNQFLLQISVLRAIRIWLQRHRDPGIRILAHCQPTAGAEENKLIEITSQSLAAMMGGADAVVVSSTREVSPVDLKRKIHTCNVLQMESQINRQRDPLQGSYFIEHLTAQIVKAVEA